jgi:hypothetical protein
MSNRKQEKRLRQIAKQRGYSQERTDNYVYGGLRNTRKGRKRGKR